jgi:hypothetical protein
MAGLMYEFTAAFIFNNQHDPCSINKKQNSQTEYESLPESSLTKTFSRYARSTQGRPSPSDSLKRINEEKEKENSTIQFFRSNQTVPPDQCSASDSLREISTNLQALLRLEEKWKSRLIAATIKIIDKIKD